MKQNTDRPEASLILDGGNSPPNGADHRVNTSPFLRATLLRRCVTVILVVMAGSLGAADTANDSTSSPELTVPVFRFAIFSAGDLEISPGRDTVVHGPVHANGDIYLEPDHCELKFLNDVTSGAHIWQHKKPGDPTPRTPGKIVFSGARLELADPLVLPMGNRASSDATHAIIEVPPAAEAPESALGRQRYYNKSDLIILVTNQNLAGVSGSFDGFKTHISGGELSSFLKPGASFFDKREAMTILATEIDVGKLCEWSRTNLTLRAVLHRELSSLYVADLSLRRHGVLPAVRLIHGEVLPPRGLTVATSNPLYVRGDFNDPRWPTRAPGLVPVPASLVADAITILSSNWSDTRSGLSLQERPAADTTLNAALLAGVPPAAPGRYSGGVENFPRLLENWRGRKCTFNGALALLFHSREAIASWTVTEIYSPPDRVWSFDRHFLQRDKLPPGTPEMEPLKRNR